MVYASNYTFCPTELQLICTRCMQGEWSVVARDSVHMVQSSCLLTVTIPKHYKKPRFLEPLKAVLTDEGAVNLECKVRGPNNATLGLPTNCVWCVGNFLISSWRITSC